MTQAEREQARSVVTEIWERGIRSNSFEDPRTAEFAERGSDRTQSPVWNKGFRAYLPRLWKVLTVLRINWQSRTRTG